MICAKASHNSVSIALLLVVGVHQACAASCRQPSVIFACSLIVVLVFDVALGPTKIVQRLTAHKIDYLSRKLALAFALGNYATFCVLHFHYARTIGWLRQPRKKKATE
jgi:hypothetical protein